MYWWCQPPPRIRGKKAQPVPEVVAEETESDQILRKMRSYLHVMLTNNSPVPIKWETFHCNYEYLMRLLRGHNYDHKPLYELYGRDQAFVNKTHRSPATRHLVDGKATLTSLPYYRDTDIELRPNLIYHPHRGANTAGWDMLLIYEAFPSSNNTASDTAYTDRDCTQYLLPVFIQTRFSTNNVNAAITLQTIESYQAHCRAFLKAHCTCAPGYQLIQPQEGNYDDHNSFVLVYISNLKHTGAADTAVAQEVPANVLVLLKEDLSAMYGPTLAYYIDGANMLRDDVYVIGDDM